MMNQKQRLILELRNLNIRLENVEKDIKNLEIKILDKLQNIENNTNNGITYSEDSLHSKDTEDSK